MFVDLISNNYESFNIEQWDELYQKAKEYRESRRVKEDMKFRDTGDVMAPYRFV